MPCHGFAVIEHHRDVDILPLSAQIWSAFSIAANSSYTSIVRTSPFLLLICGNPGDRRCGSSRRCPTTTRMPFAPSKPNSRPMSCRSHGDRSGMISSRSTPRTMADGRRRRAVGRRQHETGDAPSEDLTAIRASGAPAWLRGRSAVLAERQVTGVLAGHVEIVGLTKLPGVRLRRRSSRTRRLPRTWTRRRSPRR